MATKAANQKKPNDEFQTGSTNGVGEVMARSAMATEKMTAAHIPARRHRISMATDRMKAHSMAEPMSTPWPGSRWAKGPRIQYSSGPGSLLPCELVAKVNCPTNGGCRVRVRHAPMAIAPSSPRGRHPRMALRSAGMSKSDHTTMCGAARSNRLARTGSPLGASATSVSTTASSVLIVLPFEAVTAPNGRHISATGAGPNPLCDWNHNTLPIRRMPLHRP